MAVMVVVVTEETMELEATQAQATPQFQVPLVAREVQVVRLPPLTTVQHQQQADLEAKAVTAEPVIQTQVPILVIVVLLSMA